MLRPQWTRMYRRLRLRMMLLRRVQRMMLPRRIQWMTAPSRKRLKKASNLNMRSLKHMTQKRLILSLIFIPPSGDPGRLFIGADQRRSR